MLRICKEFRFDSAHALMGYPGKCRHIHGHSYRLLVSVEGQAQEDPSLPLSGMIMDFGQLKQCVEALIVERFDHALLLRSDAPLSRELQESYEKVEVLDFQPTCELLTLYFARLLREALAPPLRLYSVRLYETPSSYAEWTNDLGL